MSSAVGEATAPRWARLCIGGGVALLVCLAAPLGVGPRLWQRPPAGPLAGDRPHTVAVGRRFGPPATLLHRGHHHPPQGDVSRSHRTSLAEPQPAALEGASALWYGAAGIALGVMMAAVLRLWTRRPPPLLSLLADNGSHFGLTKSPTPPAVVAMLTMSALKGQKLNTSDFADAATEMQFVDVGSGGGADRLPAAYDFAQIQAYFRRRPLIVAKRVAQVVSAFGRAAMWPMSYRGDQDTQEFKERRAGMVRDTLTSLGPFYIKFGQLLSIRPDLISAGEMEELQQLCDKVPSFSNEVAMEIIAEDLGPVSSVFSEISESPVAAASLGQVYKAKLRSTGKTVAVKVQRPGALETVALDLFICRYLGQTLNDVRFWEFLDNSDLVALVDEFAVRLYNELDYKQECENGLAIARDLQGLPNVVVPRPHPQYCTTRVHVAEWIDGVKLASSHAADVQELVNLGIVAYLTQLLGTGLFHADPHPGNLIRTTDGKLAIIDFGLMLEINETQRYAIIECISHLVHRDYNRIGNDLVTLGFLPPSTDITPAIPKLASAFDMALAGGGARSINFNQLASDLAGITYDYGGRLPPFFTLLIRAIGVLEGIALVSNPNFAIINAAYPYVAERLLMDQDPRIKESLRYMIYGDSEVFNVKRVIDLLENVNTYVAVSRGQAAEVGEGVRSALVFLFSPRGAYARSLLLREIVVSLDALNRDALWELSRRVGLDAQIPAFFASLAPQLSPADRQAVDNLELLAAFARGQAGFRDGPADLLQLGQRGAALADQVRSVWPEISTGVQEFGVQLMTLMAQKVAARLIRFGLGLPSPAADTPGPVPTPASSSSSSPSVTSARKTAATATMIPTSTITGRMPSTPLPSPPPPSSPARASAPSPAAPRETLLPVSQDVKILRCGASRSLAFAIPATPGAVTPIDFFADERQILLASLKDPNELTKVGADADGWTRYQLTPSAQQFLLWRIKAVLWIEVAATRLEAGTPAERLLFRMRSSRMSLEGNTGLAVPDEIQFLVDGHMVVERGPGPDGDGPARVTGDVRLSLEAEVPPDSPLQLLPAATLSDSGTILCENILRNVAARLIDSMDKRYRSATSGSL